MQEWGLVLAGRTEDALRAHAGLVGMQTTMCGRPIVAMAHKLFGPVTVDDVTCLMCRRLVQRILAHEARLEARERQKRSIQNSLGPKRKKK